MPRSGEAREPVAGLIAWALYDFANSSFAAIIQTFVFAAYFTRAVAANETAGTAMWGNTIGLSGLAVALVAPLLGAIADQRGRRKPWLAAFTLVAVVATALLWTVRPQPSDVWRAILLVGLGTLAAELAVVFYNAMLPALASGDRIGRWSGWGWGMGYLGGLGCLLLAWFGFVAEDPWFAIGGDAGNVRATYLLTAAWFLLFSLPLLLLTPDEPASGKGFADAARDGLRQLAGTLRRVREHGAIFRFLIARMVFVDGLATLFAFGGVYAAGTFDMNERQVLLFGIVLNLTSGIGAIAFGWIDDFIGPKRTILLSLVGLAVCGSAALLVEARGAFWVLGALLGVFVGPVQAAGRSWLAHAAPANLRTELFGLFALSGKATAFLGPLLVGWLTVLSGSQRVGMSVIMVSFVVGFLLMLTVPEAGRVRDSG